MHPLKPANTAQPLTQEQPKRKPVVTILRTESTYAVQAGRTSMSSRGPARRNLRVTL
jgi:hypothetical protein